MRQGRPVSSVLQALQSPTRWFSILSPTKPLDHSAGSSMVIPSTPPRKRSSRTSSSINRTLAVCAALFFCSIAGLSLMSPSADAPEAFTRSGVGLDRRRSSHLHSMVSQGRKVLASGLITLGVMLDPDALTTRQPRKGYIKKALEKTREELEQQINQRAELQSFYETELHRMTGVLEEEESVLEEVLGDDYVNTVAKHNKHSQPSPHRL